MQRDLSGKTTTLDFDISNRITDLPVRIDLFLSDKIDKRSRNQIQKLFGERRVLIDGRPVAAGKRLRGGELVQVLLREDMDYQSPDSVPLNVVHEDEHLFIVNKSPGIVMHPAGSVLSGTLINAVHHYFSERGEACRPSLVQRLDKDTSGLVVLAKDKESHLKLQEQFNLHDLDKIYLALGAGIHERDEGYMDAPIGLGEHPLKKKMAINGEDARPARTDWTVLDRFDDCSLFGVRLLTGRQHQIRLHLAHAGHPLVGDELYGGCDKMPRQALHSYFLRFRHPATDETLEFIADLPEDFRACLLSLDAARSNSRNGGIRYTPRPWNPHNWLDTFHSGQRAGVPCPSEFETSRLSAKRTKARRATAGKKTDTNR